MNDHGQYKASIFMYYIKWQGATKIWNFVPSNLKYDYHTFKPGHIGFRYILQLRQCFFFKKAHNLLRNEDGAQIKSESLFWLYGWVYWIIDCINGMEGKWRIGERE